MAGKLPAALREGTQVDSSGQQQRPAPLRKITLGHITGTFGIKGWIKIHSDTHPRDNIVGYTRWFLSPDSGHKPGSQGSGSRESGHYVEVEAGKPQGKTIVAKLKGIDSPEQAATLVGLVISVSRDDLPALEQGEYYWADLIGFNVTDTQGVSLGSVDRLFETGANDVLVVRREVGDELVACENSAGKKKAETEILIPWVMDSVILQVDLAARIIRVDWNPDY